MPRLRVGAFPLGELHAKPTSGDRHLRHRLWDALHIGMKRCLAVIRSHYTFNLEMVSEGYYLGEETDERRSNELVEGWTNA